MVAGQCADMAKERLAGAQLGADQLVRVDAKYQKAVEEKGQDVEGNQRV